MTRTTKQRRMLVICPFPEGVAAGQRLKFEQYYNDWRAAGWEVVPAPFMDLSLWRVLYERGHLPTKFIGVLKGYVRRLRDFARMPFYDLVYCHMNVTPVGTSLPERFARLLSRRLIADVEDNVATLPNKLVAEHPNPLLRFIRSPNKARYLVRTADHVITASPTVNDSSRAINRNGQSACIPSSVDTDRFVPANHYSNEGTVTIGWTGTFSSKIYLDLLRDVFTRLAKLRPFRLRVIGNFDYELPGVDLEVVRWSLEREVEDLQAIDIGVYPLPIDDWVTGKAGLKAIQYMAFGLPCVVTDVAPNPTIVSDGENGYLVRTDEEWLEALIRLIDEPQLRKKLGEQGRRDAVARFSTKAVAARYRQVIDEVMSAKPPRSIGGPT